MLRGKKVSTNVKIITRRKTRRQSQGTFPEQRENKRSTEKGWVEVGRGEVYIPVIKVQEDEDKTCIYTEAVVTKLSRSRNNNRKKNLDIILCHFIPTTKDNILNNSKVKKIIKVH